MSETKLLTAMEVAQQLHVDDTTVRRWVKKGAIEAIILPPIGREYYKRIRIPQHAVQHAAAHPPSQIYQYQNNSDPSFLTTHDISEQLGVTNSTVTYWIREGRLVAHTVFGSNKKPVYQIAPESLTAFLVSRGQPHAVSNKRKRRAATNSKTSKQKMIFCPFCELDTLHTQAAMGKYRCECCKRERKSHDPP